MQYRLEVQVPRYRPFSPVITALRDKFPYDDGDSFEGVIGTPKRVDLIFVSLEHPLSEKQKTYLEHGKTAEMIVAYSVTMKLRRNDELHQFL
jgi:hypothetical protein